MLPEDSADQLSAFHDPNKAAAEFPEFIKKAWPILEPSGVPLEWGWQFDCFCDQPTAGTPWSWRTRRWKSAAGNR